MGLMAEIRKRGLWSHLMPRLLALQKAPRDIEDLPQLARLAERMQPALRRAFLSAVAKAQGKIDLERLASAINANSLNAAEAAVRISEFPEVYGELAGPLRSGFLVGSGLAVRELAQSGVELSFNIINPHAVQYANTILPNLVGPYQENARETIRTFIARSVAGEMSPKAAAKDIRDLIGLDPRRVAAADNFWARLVEDGKSDADIVRRVGRYMDSLLRQRADVIARTEIHRAAGAGQQAAWDEAAKQGLIVKAEYAKVWIVTWDEVLCDVCEPMDGVSVEVDDDFDTPNGPMQFPDMHPQCRCTTNIVRKDELDDYLARLDRPDEKPQSRS